MSAALLKLKCFYYLVKGIHNVDRGPQVHRVQGADHFAWMSSAAIVMP
jgi:hypothetical protein